MMTTVEDIRSGLINKILTIENKDLLKALDQLITSGISDLNIVETLPEQKLMLEMSEDDIKNGRLISQDAMNKRNLEWLNG